MLLAPHRRQSYPKPQERRNTYPRSSRKRHITFATISSFFSSGGKFAPGLTLVRAACLSVAVAPRQSAKSIVEDCQIATYQRGNFKSNNDSPLTFCPRSSSSTMEYGTCHPTTRSASCTVCGDVCNTYLFAGGAGCSNQNAPQTFRMAQKLCATLLIRARVVARGPVCPSVMTSLTNRLYSFVSPLSRGGCSIICPLASHTNGCGLNSPRDK